MADFLIPGGDRPSLSTAQRSILSPERVREIFEPQSQLNPAILQSFMQPAPSGEFAPPPQDFGPQNGNGNTTTYLLIGGGVLAAGALAWYFLR